MTYKEKTLVRFKGIEGEIVRVTLSYREIADPGGPKLHKDLILTNEDSFRFISHGLIRIGEDSIEKEVLSPGINNPELRLYCGEELYFEVPVSEGYDKKHIAEIVKSAGKTWRAGKLEVDEICVELGDLEVSLR